MLSRLPVRDKLRAFAIHLTVSCLVAGLNLWLLISLWFPMPYFTADGGWAGIRLVVAVDVVLGPLLSLVIYDRRKSRKALLFDYSVVATLQCLALLFGMWTFYQQRTAMVVFTDGRFFTVDAGAAEGMGPRAAEIIENSDSVPAYAQVDMTSDPERQQQLRREALSSGEPLFQRSELLEPFQCRDLTGRGTEGIQPTADGSDEWGTRSQAEFAEVLAKRGGLASDYLLVPATARYRDLTLVFRRDSCALVAWLPFTRKLGETEPQGKAGGRE